MTEPSVNDLSAMSLPGGKEMEPVVLIDTTGSMSYKRDRQKAGSGRLAVRG
jgi:hypothetical protein